MFPSLPILRLLDRVCRAWIEWLAAEQIYEALRVGFIRKAIDDKRLTIAAIFRCIGCGDVRAIEQKSTCKPMIKI